MLPFRRSLTSLLTTPHAPSNMQCFNTDLLIREGMLLGFEKLIIFSDGGPKHFKMTGTLSFFCFLRNELAIDLEYHFYESNHGHSICDAVASHAKKAINVQLRDTQRIIKNSKEIAEIIRGIKKHEADVAFIDNPHPKFKTFNGIRKMMRFSFGENVIFGHRLSKIPEAEAVWDVEVEPFGNLEQIH